MLKGFERSANRWAWLLVLGTLPLMACGEEPQESSPDQAGPVVSQPLIDQAQDLVNQANTAQREGRYAEALDLFKQVLEIHPNHPVPQFGGLMAATAVGDTALAQSLREKLTTTGPELLEMLGPGGTMGGMAPGAPGAGHMPSGGMPLGHPTVDPPVDTPQPKPGAMG